MSPITKRDATEAFDGDEAIPTTPTKRRRKKNKRADDLEDATNAVTKGSASDKEMGAFVTKTKHEIATGNLVDEASIENDNAAAKTSGPRMRHKKRKSKAVPEASTGQALVVVKDDTNPTQEHKKRRRKQQRAREDSEKKAAHEASESQAVILAEDQVTPVKEFKRKQKKKEGSRRERPRHKDPSEETTSWESEQGWDMSIAGGYFLDQDPLLPKGDQHVILPTKSNILIYSTKTSLLVRSLPISLVDPVTSCVISQSDSDLLLVSTLGGSIFKLDWTTGRRLCQWRTRPGLLRIFGIPSSQPPDDTDRILLINSILDGDRELSQCELGQSSDTLLEVSVLQRAHRFVPRVIALDSGKMLVACADDKLMLCSTGTSFAVPRASSDDYVWREIPLPGKVVSFDARQRQEPASGKTRSVVDVVVGLANGLIVAYDDMSRITGKERRAQGSEITPRRLHWHRDAVCSVKWSQDGNYLISGGHETVLVLWQLDTNQQQYLPHLSAPILNVVVSASGASYAMRLADNSVMILSTSDLLPTTNISGVSVARNTNQRLVLAGNSNEPDQLLLVTPTDVANQRSSSGSSATMLQTFDSRSNHQVSRQALARNVTTVVNVNPKGQSIVDPDVIQLKMSSDGRWLATVDQWTPPEHDLQPLQQSGSKSYVGPGRTETCLRFWSLDQATGMWQMVTRVDQPHSAELNSVLELAVNPVRAEFATVGRDGYLRLWTPLLRVRNGVTVKNLADQPLYSWVCVHAIQPDPQSLPHSTFLATVAYSEDGSTIAASWSPLQGPRSVHFVDTRTGFLRVSQSSLCTPGDMQLAFSGTRLLLLSDNFCVWDIVNSRLAFSITLKNQFVRGNGSFLAANPIDQTFAIALNPSHYNAPAAVAIFDARAPDDVLYQGRVHGHVKALLPTVKSQGYVIVDGEARIRHLRHADRTMKTLTLTPGTKPDAIKGLNDVFGAHKTSQRDSQTDAIPNGIGSRSSLGGELSQNLSRRSLDEVLEQQASTTGLPVTALFEQVANLFARHRVAT